MVKYAHIGGRGCPHKKYKFYNGILEAVKLGGMNWNFRWCMSYDWSSSIDTWNIFNEYFNFFVSQNKLKIANWPVFLK